MTQAGPVTQGPADGRMPRRALLAAAAAGLTAGCSSRPAERTAPPSTPDPQTALLISVIRDKERLVALYQQAARTEAKAAAALEPFRLRHAAHLAALRELLPDGAETQAASGAPSAPHSSPSPPAPEAAESGRAVSLDDLGAAERRAAAGRPAQTTAASPVLAQLLASIGACEAVHAIALGRLRG